MIATGSPQVEALASAFSTALFKELAQDQPGVIVRERVAVLADFMGQQTEASLGLAFELAHERLQRDYRNEYVFKNGIVSKIVFGKHSPRTASALLELRMGSSWADVMIVNGTTTTYEIKTDLDQFGRLATQLSDYSSRSEFVNVVTSDTRATAAERHLPSHVGIVAMRRSGALTTVRKAESNIDRMSSADMYSMLRASEATAILHNYTGYTADVPRAHMWSRLREVFAELPVQLAHAGVVTELRGRAKHSARLASSSDFPPSLRALAYGTSLSAIGRERLLERLLSPMTLLLEGC